MGISNYPSHIVLPQAEKPYPSILDFLAAKFPSVPRDSWENRITEEKVLDVTANPITHTTAFFPGMRISYFREVRQEPVIPFLEKILFQDDEILVACKPQDRKSTR